MIRIGLIGCGGQGRGRVSTPLMRIDGVTPAACADIDEVNARRAMNDCGFERMYLDYDRMLEEEALDAVVVATPHHVLKDAVLAAIARGLPVYVEKPMAMNAAEASEIVEAARTAGVPVMVGYCQRYAEGRRLMKDLIERGAVGQVVQVNAVKGAGQQRGWLADPKTGGGPLRYIGVHITDQVLWMLGERPKRVYAEIDWREDTGAEQSAAFTMRFPSGVLADVLCSQNVGQSWDFIEIAGPDGRVRAEWPSNTVWVQSKNIPEYRHPTVIQPRTSGAAMFDDQMRAWVESLRDGSPPPITAEDAMSVLEVIDAVFESDRRKGPVQIG